MKLTLKNGIIVNIREINDISSFRGFWLCIDEKYYVNSINTSAIQEEFISGYSVGFDTKGKSVQDHLFEKITLNEKLTNNELEAFYEIVDLRNPSDEFRYIMYKHQNIQFWTLDKTMNDSEKNIYKSGNVYADLIIE